MNTVRPLRVLLLLDEFEKIQEGIESGIASSIVPENLRYILHKYSGISAIFAGARRLKHMRQSYWSALFGLGQRIGVGPLAQDDARELVTRPARGVLAFVPEARDRIVYLCAGQPYLIQALCAQIYLECSRIQQRVVTVSLVDQVAGQYVESSEHFQTLWEQFVSSTRQRLVPGIGNAINATTAAGITEAVGWAADAYFEDLGRQAA